MFTGIIESIGRVISSSQGRLTIDADGGDWLPGESIAVNGCCLTVLDERLPLQFDLSPETLQRTNLGDLIEGSLVNLERAMPANGRFGGHFVQGHVDGVAQVVHVRPEGNASVIRFRLPRPFDRYLVDKASIALDGVSLTAVSPDASEFDVWLIPATLDATNLSERRAGDSVNFEVDLVAKYVERLASRSA